MGSTHFTLVDLGGKGGATGLMCLSDKPIIMCLNWYTYIA